MWASRRDLGQEKKRMSEDSRPTLCIKLRLAIDQTRYCSIIDPAVESRLDKKKGERQTRKEREQKPRHPGFPRGPPPWY